MKAFRHSLFPTLVTQTEYADSQNFLSTFIDNCDKYFINGITHEGIVSLDLHLDPNFESLFQFLNHCAVNYLNELGVNYDLFDINFTKSWVNTLTKSLIYPHDHLNHHLSVAYYVQIPAEADHFLRFSDINKNRHPFYGINRNLDHITNFSLLDYDIFPKRGTAVIFPSSLTHQAVARNHLVQEEDSPILEKKELMSRRICIGADIVLTYKEKQNQFYGIQPVSNWKTFT